MKILIERLRESSLGDMDVDGHSRMALHAKMLSKKRMLREVFTEFHHIFHRLEKRFVTATGNAIELGAGIAPIRNSYPDVLATDIVPDPALDLVINAENMDLETGSVRVIFGQNCFHHFPHPDKFFDELNRVLPVGGCAILLEPYYGIFAEFLYKRLFATEGFDKNFPDWETPVAGPMNGANQALSYIVFVRDREIFEKKFLQLEIIHAERCENYLKYLCSGGLNFKQLLPDWMSPVIRVMEYLLSPFNVFLSLHHVVVIRKKS